MKLPCEIWVEKLSVIRAMVTQEMVGTFGLTQDEVAKKLQISQPAVSQYLAGLRGRKRTIYSNQKLKAVSRKLAKEIVEGKSKFPKNACAICKLVK